LATGYMLFFDRPLFQLQGSHHLHHRFIADLRRNNYLCALGFWLHLLLDQILKVGTLFSWGQVP